MSQLFYAKMYLDCILNSNFIQKKTVRPYISVKLIEILCGFLIKPAFDWKSPD